MPPLSIVVIVGALLLPLFMFAAFSSAKLVAVDCSEEKFFDLLSDISDNLLALGDGDEFRMIEALLSCACSASFSAKSC